MYIISGLQRHNVVFQKQSKQWVSRPVYKETTQRFRDDLMEQVIHRRLDPSVIFRDSSSKVKVPCLAANIAPLPKPNKEDVMKAHKSRFTASSE